MIASAFRPRIIGRVEVELDGRTVWETKNVVVNTGYQRLAAWLASNTANGGTPIVPPSFIAVGNGSGTPAATDTQMFIEAARTGISSAGVISTYTVRLVSVFLGTVANTTLTEAGLFDINGDNGTVSTNTGNCLLLIDTTKAWTTNQWVGYTAYIWGGTDAGSYRTITANTSNQLTVASCWPSPPTPDTTSTYAIGGGNMFAHAPISVTKADGQIMNVIWSLTVQTA